MTGKLLDLLRDQVGETAVDLERGEADCEAICRWVREAVRVEEDRSVALNAVVDAAGHGYPMEVVVATQQANERALDVGNQLGLTLRARVVLETGLQRLHVTGLHNYALHSYLRPGISIRASIPTAQTQDKILSALSEQP